MNCKVGELIGNTVGRVVDVDISEDGVDCGDFLRVRIECDLEKVIARGHTVNLDGCQIWIPFCYEKLPRMCF